MSRKSKSYVRILTHVLRAIADLNEDRGSTTPRITEQVQRAFNIASTGDMKPKNLAVLVKRALKHGVNVGVLRLTSGKYRLTLGQSPVGTCAVSAARQRCKRKRRDRFRAKMKRGKRILGKRRDKRLRRVLSRKRKILKQDRAKRSRLLGKVYLKKSKLEKRV